jgi:hypothetical protein
MEVVDRVDGGDTSASQRRQDQWVPQVRAGDVNQIWFQLQDRPQNYTHLPHCKTPW